MPAFEIELIRFVFVAFAAIVLLLTVVAAEWTLRRRFGDEIPGAITWAVRLGAVAALLIVTAPILGLVTFAETMSRVDRGLNATLLEPGGQRFTLSGILTFLFFFAVTVGISRLLRRALTRSHVIKRVTDVGTVGVIERLVHYGVMAVGLTFALSAAGVNLNGLVTAGAAFAVGIGFALQGVALNFVSGLILLVERAIKPGDILHVQGDRVRVQRMGIRTTIVRSRNEEDLIIPNSILAQSTVRNFTFLDKRCRVACVIGVSYSSDVQEVFSVLLATAQAFSPRQKKPEPRVLLTGFGASSVDFEVSIWTKDAWNDRVAQSNLYSAIWDALKAAEIEIAFPQLDVHLDSGD